MMRLLEAAPLGGFSRLRLARRVLLASAARGRSLLGVAVCACVWRLRSRLRASLRLRAAFAIATACNFALRSSTALSSLRAYGVRACPGDLPFCVGRVVSARFGPYGTLGRVRAALAPGLDPEAGRPLLRGAATLQRLVWLGLQRFCGCSPLRALDANFDDSATLLHCGR